MAEQMDEHCVPAHVQDAVADAKLQEEQEEQDAAANVEPEPEPETAAGSASGPSRLSDLHVGVSVSSLAELAKLAGIDEKELLEYKEVDFEDLTKELGVAVKDRVRLRKLYRQMIDTALSYTRPVPPPASPTVKSPALPDRGSARTPPHVATYADFTPDDSCKRALMALIDAAEKAGDPEACVQCRGSFKVGNTVTVVASPKNADLLQPGDEGTVVNVDNDDADDVWYTVRNSTGETDEYSAADLVHLPPGLLPALQSFRQTGKLPPKFSVDELVGWAVQIGVSQEDAEDVHQTKYFPHLTGNLVGGTAGKIIGICIPCYNEPWIGLDNTLTSLSELHVPNGFTLSVIILMDGVKGTGAESVPAKCTRKYLTKKFGVKWEDFEGDGMKQTTIFESRKKLDVSAVAPRTTSFGLEGLTRVLRTASERPVSAQRSSSASSAGTESVHAEYGSIPMPPTSHMQVSLLVKKENKRKHNSHEWFMAAFAKELECEYIFCTDCSTVFDSGMLVKLTEHLEENRRTTAVCGRQRVMAASIQNAGDPSKAGKCELFDAPGEYMLRQIQTYDFEADHPVSKAAYDLLGFLPVLPGPCGMYRYKDLANGRYKKYFETVNMPSEDCGLWLANLKIAEDRIPSLFAVFTDPNDLEKREESAFETHWVRDAVFYFEAEMTLKSLVLQRRRWLNGTNAGYVYIAQNLIQFVWGSKHGTTTKSFATFMILMQLVQVFVLSLGPGIFTAIIFGTTNFLAIHYSKALFHVDGDEHPGLRLHDHAQQLATYVAATYLAIYLLFLWVHRIQYEYKDGKKQKKEGSDFKGWAFGMVTVANIFLMVLFISGLVLSRHQFMMLWVETFDDIDRPAGKSPLGNTCFDVHKDGAAERWLIDKTAQCGALANNPDLQIDAEDLLTTMKGRALEEPQAGSVYCCGDTSNIGDDYTPPFVRCKHVCEDPGILGLSVEFRRYSQLAVKLRLQHGTVENCDHQATTYDSATGKLTLDDRPEACIEGSTFQSVLEHQPVLQYSRWGDGPLDSMLQVETHPHGQRGPLAKGTMNSLHSYADTSNGCLTNDDCDEGLACLNLNCPTYKRCGMNTTVGRTEAANSCGMACWTDSDCNTGMDEVCLEDLPAPEGCLTSLAGLSILVGFSLIPLVYAIIDIPASRSFKSPMLMIRSAPVFIFFMPTFVAFFSAYSTNRLADVSWGQRAVEDGLDAGQQRIEKQAKCIAIIVPLLNIGYAVTISYVHLIAPQDVTVVASIIMVVAGFTLSVSLIRCASL